MPNNRPLIDNDLMKNVIIFDLIKTRITATRIAHLLHLPEPPSAAIVTAACQCEMGYTKWVDAFLLDTATVFFLSIWHNVIFYRSSNLKSTKSDITIGRLR
jgi:hypothetical protein